MVLLHILLLDEYVHAEEKMARGLRATYTNLTMA